MATVTSIKAKIDMLDSAGFQILCDEYLIKFGYKKPVCLGTKAGTHKTTKGTPDTYFTNDDGRYVFVEYTTQKDKLFDKIKKDVEKCLNKISTNVSYKDIAEIVYCHTSSDIKPDQDLELKEMCRKHEIKFTIIGIDEMAENLLKKPYLVKDILNLEIDTLQIQDLEDFKRQYDSNSLAAPLDTAFLFRDEEITKLNDAFNSVQVVLLCGPAGTGKTRLALEYAKIHSEKFEEKLLCFYNRSLPLYYDLINALENKGKYFFLVDDANQLSELKHIIEFANKQSEGYQVNILITVRDYAAEKVKNDISNIVKYKIIKLENFTNDEIKELSKINYDISDSLYLRRIAEISKGNARIAFMASKISAETDSIENILDVSDLYDNYYGKIIRETKIDSNKSLLATAGIIAFLNIIYIDNICAMNSVLDIAGLSESEFRDNIHKLHENEIVDIYYDKAARFSDQCLSNYILKYVFCDKKIIKLSEMIKLCFETYKNHTIQSVSTLVNVFYNDDIETYIHNEIHSLIQELRNNKADNLLEYAKAFYPLDETTVLSIIYEIIDNTEQIELPAEKIDLDKEKNYKTVNDDVIIILGGFAYTENSEAASDLFFSYFLKRPDLYIEFYHAATISFGITYQAILNECRIQLYFFKKLKELANQWSNPYLTLFFLDISCEFLKIYFEYSENTDEANKILLCHTTLNYTENIYKYRKLIWEELIKLSDKSIYNEKILKILNEYGNHIDDTNKYVIKSDAGYIKELSNRIFDSNKLKHLLTADFLKQKLSIAECKAEQLNKYLDTKKFKLYQLLNGLKYNNKTNKEILSYISSGDKVKRLEDALNIYEECIEKNIDYYELPENINLIIHAISKEKTTFIAAVRLLLAAEYIDDIDIPFVIQQLFNYFSSDEVFNILSSCNKKNRNVWEYFFYHEIPQSLINKKILKNLYTYLADDSDKSIKSSKYRDIMFFEKFVSIDKDIYINGSKLILEKSSYSKFMVKIYFTKFFNEYIYNPNEAVRKFNNNLELLKKIYLCLDSTGQTIDYNGTFLYEICKKDKNFLIEYVDSILENSIHNHNKNYKRRFTNFLNDEDFPENFSKIVDRVMNNTKYFINIKVFFIKDMISSNKETETEAKKIDQWIIYYIKENCTDKLKIRCLFEAIAQLSMAALPTYIEVLCSVNEDFEMFKNIPLTPYTLSFCSWSNSAVPMYSDWIAQLNKLLPLFSCGKFIKHKELVENKIQELNQQIEQEELNDILMG